MRNMLKRMAAVCLAAMLSVCAIPTAADTTKAVTALAYDDILYFWEELTLEERAAYSAEWVPKVEEELKMNPDYRGVHYYETRHVYGLPDENSISQEAAHEIAARNIEQLFGIDSLNWENVYVKVYYDITDPQTPLWKMYFAIDELDPWVFIWAEIHAQTGEVHRLIERDHTMQYYEFY